MEIKICGITNTLEIMALNKLKPDYIGFVFAESKRKINIDEAEKLYSMVSKDIKVIGVFRNNTKEYIEEVLLRLPLYAVQLHGDETEEFIEYFNKNYNCQVWKGQSISNETDLDKALNFPVSVLILDGKSPGGGEKFCWDYLKKIKLNKKVFLAGGIDVQNIDEAMKIENVSGIDLSSGVESIVKGIRKKDPVKMEKVIRKVRERNER